MQAIPAQRRSPLDARWLQHLSLLSALGMLFASVVVGRAHAPTDIAERLPGRFLAPPGSPAQEWLPVRVPVRTSITPDPAQTAQTAADAAGDVVASAGGAGALGPATGAATLSAARPAVEWVQAHRKTALFSAPDDASPREIE